MIRIGLNRFDEHSYLNGKKKSSLYEYASHLPIVELDTSYYHIPKVAVVEKWVNQVPANFRFILKFPRYMTNQEPLPPETTMAEEVAKLKVSFAPLFESNKLFCVLAQFSASFKCTKESVAHLRQLRHHFPDWPIAVELRDASWYQARYLDSMRTFMTAQEFSLAVIDEPKKLATTIPLDAYVTNSQFTLCRFHGRNDLGWQATGPNAQAVRTNYHYSPNELIELKGIVEQVATQSAEVAVIFNNNAGGDAAENGVELIKIMELDYDGLNPTQLGLF
ncbi:MAG: DUF72 domain-containing protein [Enterococcus sp.]